MAFVADFGTQNFNLKTKFDMENKTSINNENGNDANRLLAVVLIVMLWIMWFASIGLLSELCDGDYFWWRTLAIYSFTMVTIKVSGLVWKHYR